MTELAEIYQSKEYIESQQAIDRLVPEINAALDRVSRLCGDRYFVYIAGSTIAIRHKTNNIEAVEGEDAS